MLRLKMRNKYVFLFFHSRILNAHLAEWTSGTQQFSFIQCIKLNPSWAKGYARKGAALHGARKFDESIAAYEAGIKLEDSPALRKGLREVQDAKCTSSLSLLCPMLKRLQHPRVPWGWARCLLIQTSLESWLLTQKHPST
jgi:hypothetical protein